LYRLFHAEPSESKLEWTFPNSAEIKFAHMEHEKNKYDWQGSQIPFIGFDELTHFSKSQFFYMLSRNRSTSGIKPYIRATCNADASSWVAEFISWYWDEKTGYAIPERSGVVRWFIRQGESLFWGDSREELIERYGETCEPKSFTFIAAKVDDNKILLEKDPNYLSNLKALPTVERERLLNGNWKVMPAAGLYFKRTMFEIVDAVPKLVKELRYWDRAATEKTDNNNPAFTVGLKSGRSGDGIIYVTDMVRDRKNSYGVETMIKNTASQDGIYCVVGIEQDPGQAGKAEVGYYVRQLIGYSLFINPATKDKITRSGPASAQAGAGNIKLLRGSWNEDFLNEVENFPEGEFKDIVDCLSGTIQYYTQNPTPKFQQTIDDDYNSTIAPSLKNNNIW